MQDHTWYRPGAEPKEGEADTRPAFRLRMASLMERAAFDAELEGRHQAAPVPAFVMLDTAIAGVHALAGEDADELEQLLRSVNSEAGPAEISEAEQTQIAEIQTILAKSWPPYRQLVEQNARYRNLMPILAFQRFVDGWENLDGTDGKTVEYERDKAGNIPDAVLRRIHPALIYAAGNRAHNFQYAVGEEKN